MKTLIVCVSIHHGNTLKIAKTMAKALKAKIVKPGAVTADMLSKYDLIGFGSGIYMFKHHKSLLELAERLPEMKGKKAFVFSTSGAPHKAAMNYHKDLREKLKEKKFKIIGEFNCQGFDTVGPFILVGGLNKGRPNGKDLENARVFAKKLR
jgi:flavodoxin